MSPDKHAFPERVHVVVVYYRVSEILVDLRILILFSSLNPVDNWAQVLILAEAQPVLGKEGEYERCLQWQSCSGTACLTMWSEETAFLCMLFFVKYIFYDTPVNWKRSPGKPHHTTENSGIYIFYMQAQEGCEEIPLVQGKEQQLRFAAAAVKRYSMFKVRETQVRR